MSHRSIVSTLVLAVSLVTGCGSSSSGSAEAAPPADAMATLSSGAPVSYLVTWGPLDCGDTHEPGGRHEQITIEPTGGGTFALLEGGDVYDGYRSGPNALEFDRAEVTDGVASTTRVDANVDGDSVFGTITATADGSYASCAMTFQGTRL